MKKEHFWHIINHFDLRQYANDYTDGWFLNVQKYFNGTLTVVSDCAHCHHVVSSDCMTFSYLPSRELANEIILYYHDTLILFT